MLYSEDREEVTAQSSGTATDYQGITPSQGEDTSCRESVLQAWEQALGTRKAELDERESALAGREAEFDERERLLADCEKDLTEHKKGLSDREAQLAARESKLAEGELVAANRDVSLQEREKAFSAQEEGLRKQQEAAAERIDQITKRESVLLDRELGLSRRENELRVQEAELARKMAQATEEILRAQLEEKASFEQSLADERTKALSEIQSQMEDRRREFDALLDERERAWQVSTQRQMDNRLKEAETEAAAILEQVNERANRRIETLTQDATEKQTQVDRMMEEVGQRITALDQREADVQKREDELDIERRRVDRDARRLQSKQEELEARESDLGATVQAAIGDKISSFNEQLADKDRSLAEARESCRRFIAEQDAIENFKVSIGETPEIIQDRQNRMHREIEALKQELARRAPESLERSYQELQTECRQLRAELADTSSSLRIQEQKNRELAPLEERNVELEDKIKRLDCLVEELQSEAESYRQQISRLSVKEAQLSDYNARVAEIQKGYLTTLIGAGLPIESSEIQWLQNISEQCKNYGVSFPRRILYAFHTALKISDWSSITVLAGVSGTGKSELPKLYAAFGGLNFIAVPVQPNWDSQESMLGFFNSIDNRFEPEDLLRFLVQCTEDETYSKYMSIVLLDEMNLAHVEHYFADFLSKLESRRGSSKKDLPSVEVKLGAGVPPYRLNLVRTILWTGTMNQDETTKSLSDKVLDRGLVINFPRPRVLCSREDMPVLQEQLEKMNRPMLTKVAWNKWVVRKIKLEGDQRKEMDHYKAIVERINNELEHVGRALGHRVWQSIEYYMINYPTVIEERTKLNPGEMSTELQKAMKIAFEDQIVQKIMPKLRGVETRGHAKTYLDAIEAMLEDEGFESLKDDFEIACEQGYGQFIWSSAKYIEADEAEIQNLTSDTEEEKTSDEQE